MSKRNLLGYRPDSRDPRDYPAEPLFKVAQAPATADVSATRPPGVEDQGPEGSCTTFGTGRAWRTYVRRVAPQFDFAWNHQQLYNCARLQAGSFDQDSGLTLRDLMKTLQTVGVGREELWPYDPANLFTTPPAEVLDDAFEHKAFKYHVLKGSNAIRLAIASGYPVVLGIALYESWDDDSASGVERTGLLALPERGEKIIGYHCMDADVYNTKFENRIGVVNQYSEYWGDAGMCWAQYEYFDNPANMMFAMVMDIFGSQAEYDHGTAVGQKPPS